MYIPVSTNTGDIKIALYSEKKSEEE